MAIPAYYSLIQKGSYGPDEALVQTWLNGVRDQCSYYPALTIDGHFGTRSENAVKEFQLRNSMNMDGKVGANTWNALYAKYTAKHGLAEEYLELMGIRNTQFIVVRHHGTDNPHCHIVFNRVNFDGKVISDSNDFKRNEKVTKMLKDKYSLTYSEGKQSVKTEKLHASEKVKYEIYRAVKEALRSADTWKEFQNKLLKMGVEMEFKYKGNTNEVQGIRFIKNGLSFKGSGIDRSFSWSRLDAALDHNHVTSLENDVSQKQPYHEQSHGSVIDNLVEVTGTGGVFMPSVAPTEDEKEAERLRRKKKRRKGRSL